MMLNSSDDSRSFGFRNNFEIDWRVLNELRVKGRFSITKTSTRSEVFKSPKASEFVGAESTVKGTYTETNGEGLDYDADFNVTYGKLFNEKHMVNAVGGVRLATNQSKSSAFVSRGFIDTKALDFD